MLRSGDPPKPALKLVASVLSAALAMAIIWPSASDVWKFDRIISAIDNRVVVAQWFFDHVPPGDTVLQTGSRYGLVQFWDRRFSYKQWRWDGVGQVFMLDGGRRFSREDRPDWIIVQDSPLPSTTQPIVTEVMADGYVRAAEFPAFSPSEDLVYDQQDAFYVPLAGLDHVVRPGPNFLVYKHEPREQ
jgi:hypothetical protein